MDKMKRTQTQQASIRSRGRIHSKVTKGRGRNASANSFKPYKTQAAKPSRYRGHAVEDDRLDLQAQADESREAAAAASPNSLFGGIGGMEEIISMMGKANQMIRLFQQITPIFKMFGMLGGGAKATTASLRANRKSMLHSKIKSKQHAGTYRYTKSKTKR
ncbi:MAG: hypothetical protein K0S39_1951 [Paenibacillus sp.]|jgi:hypothetical protein|nr:hypothetical protein [Paenibacillus sp.]